MPYQTIPEVPTEANLSRLIGRLRGSFVNTLGSNISTLGEAFTNGCPDSEQISRLSTQINNIKEISVNITDRLSRIEKIPRVIKPVGKTLKTVAKGLRFIPFPPFFPGAKVSAVITLLQELGTQFESTGTSIELALSTKVDLDAVLKNAANKIEKVDIALELCDLAKQLGITLPSDLLNSFVNGTDSESSNALQKLNDLLNQGGGGGTGTGGDGTGTGGGGTGTGGDGTGTGGGGTGAGGTGTGGATAGLGREQYTGPDGTVYTLEVIQVKSDFTRAPRRQAIARNIEGKIKFESSKSFSSSVDVLKREVKFRIDNSQV